MGANRWTQARAEELARTRGVELTERFQRIDRPIKIRCLTCGYEGTSTIHRMRSVTKACWACSRVQAGKTGRLSDAEIRA